MSNSNNFTHVYTGKVREVYDLGYDLLAFEHTNRQSAFDRQICEIPDKGSILTESSKWWFNKTKHIVPNHFLYSDQHIMVCKKCTPIKVEVVVRGYITGSTSTSLWTHYKNGERVYCGLTFPDGLVKNQKLKNNVVTPTTKGEEDIPISSAQVVEMGLATQEEWDYMYQKALELFDYGQYVASTRGLILVDTKYEFGKDSEGNVILMDEVHTCDSSRYWMKNSYQDRFSKGLEPEKLDKDIVRGFIRSKCDPYKEPLPEIPTDLINKARNSYMKFYSMLTGQDLTFSTVSLADVVSDYFDTHHNKMGVIVAGSEKDQLWIEKLANEFKKNNLYTKVHVASAHKNTQLVLDLLNHYNSFNNRKIVFVAVAGMSNALGGVLSANTKYPVINCPPFKDKLDMKTNINSSIQNPSNVPSMLILSPANTALAVKKILNL